MKRATQLRCTKWHHLNPIFSRRQQGGRNPEGIFKYPHNGVVIPANFVSVRDPDDHSNRVPNVPAEVQS